MPGYSLGSARNRPLRASNAAFIHSRPVIFSYVFPPWSETASLVDIGREFFTGIVFTRLGVIKNAPSSFEERTRIFIVVRA